MSVSENFPTQIIPEIPPFPCRTSVNLTVPLEYVKEWMRLCADSPEIKRICPVICEMKIWKIVDAV